MKIYDLMDYSGTGNDLPTHFLIYGEDVVLQQVVTRILIPHLTRDDLENHTALSADVSAEIISRGSIFGSRLLIIELQGKWGRTNQLCSALRDSKEYGDALILRAKDAPKPGSDLEKHLTFIECKKPTNKRSKEKIIGSRLKHYGFILSEDALKKFTDCVDDTAHVESTLITLSLFYRRGTNLGLSDILPVLKEPTLKKDITRALLRGHLPKLLREVLEGDPVYTLTILHNTLFKLYSWLEMKKSGLEQEKIVELLEIPTRFAKEWKIATTKYSSQLVRITMQVVSDAFDAEIRGNQDWPERLQAAIYKMS